MQPKIARGSKLLLGVCFFLVAVPSIADEFVSNNYDVYRGDVDSDGNDDLYLSSKPLVVLLTSDPMIPITIPGAEQYLLTGNIDGSFSAPVEDDTVDTSSLTEQTQGISFGDFNDDGIDDILVQAESTGERGVIVAGSQSGTLPTIVGDFVNLNGSDASLSNALISMSDLDQDGDADLVVTWNSGLTTNLINLGTGIGTLSAPIAVNDTYMVAENSTSNSLSVLVNDSDPNSGSLTLSSVGTPDNGGSASVSGSSVIYTPAGAFSGTETFTYVVSDANGSSAQANVSVTVTSGGNMAPVAVDDAYQVTENTTNNAFSVLANDSDGDSDPLSVSAVGATDNGGTAVVNSTSDGITYTPATAFVGTETFSYTASDGNGGTDTATVTVTVDAVVTNLSPVLSTIGNRSVAEGAQLTITISATDPDGPSPLTLTQVNSLPGSPSILTDNGDGTGTLSWTPTTGDAAGSPYSVTLTASDGLAQIDFETFSVSVTAPGVTTVTYEHNALGQRVSKTNGAQVTHYLYNQAGQLIAEIDAGTGQTLREYVYVNGEQLAVIDDTDTVNEALYFVQNDHLGTPQQITDDAETVVWSADYAPFGQASILVNSIANNIRFPGQYEDDETGNHYNYFRTYDPSIGRYTQSDPIGLDGGLNRYIYAYDAPLNNIDPLGLATISGGVTGSWFVGGVGGSATATAGVDTEGNFCVSVTVCGRLGGGASISGRGTVSVGTGTFCEGSSGSGGFFAGGGFGPFASVSTRTNANADTTVSLGLGAGAGASGGGQFCETRTFCR